MLDDAIPAAKPKLLDQVRNAIRRKHHSLRTEETYVALYPLQRQAAPGRAWGA